MLRVLPCMASRYDERAGREGGTEKGREGWTMETRMKGRMEERKEGTKGE